MSVARQGVGGPVSGRKLLKQNGIKTKQKSFGSGGGGGQDPFAQVHINAKKEQSLRASADHGLVGRLAG